MKSFELERQIKESQGHKFIQRIREFSISISIFGKNYIELKRHIETELEPNYFLKIQHKGYAQQREEGQIETVRLIHNFLASAFSLVEHTRNYYNKYYKDQPSQFPEYQLKVDEKFANNLLANFVKCFRQYIQHFQPSFISYQSNLTNSPEELNAKIVLSKNDLNLFKNWNSKAKQYIQELESDLNILSLIINYHALVKEFYDWFAIEQGKIHEKEISKFLAMEQELKAQVLREEIAHYTSSDSYSNHRFKEAVLRMYKTEEQRKIEKLPIQKQLDEMMFTLKKKGFIDDSTEQEIRNRYAF